MVSDDEEAPSHRIAEKAKIGLQAVQFSQLDANMIAQDSTRLELCGCNLKRAWGVFLSALECFKANIDAETTFVFEHTETLEDLRAWGVMLGKIGDGD